jgi:insulysin
MPLPKTLIKSDCDDREYRFVDLPNKMKCLLISDMQADMSAAAINVHIGSASDPRPLYGVAHFLEHMLFQGTEKYPIENEYSEFMKNNGGYDNAFTSLTDTNYHFEVSNEGFEEGLDRLSQFFISPNFSENSAAREVNAVDSEWEMSKQSDGWHFYNLTCALSEKESNYNRFACGNKASLANPTIRESLLEFHKKWYSANIMTLCVCGKESLDWLEK